MYTVHLCMYMCYIGIVKYTHIQVWWVDTMYIYMYIWAIFQGV